jgi:hypothetical protein
MFSDRSVVICGLSSIDTNSPQNTHATHHPQKQTKIKTTKQHEHRRAPGGAGLHPQLRRSAPGSAPARPAQVTIGPVRERGREGDRQSRRRTGVVFVDGLGWAGLFGRSSRVLPALAPPCSSLAVSIKSRGPEETRPLTLSHSFIHSFIHSFVHSFITTHPAPSSGPSRSAPSSRPTRTRYIHPSIQIHKCKRSKTECVFVYAYHPSTHSMPPPHPPRTTTSTPRPSQPPTTNHNNKPSPT